MLFVSERERERGGGERTTEWVVVVLLYWPQ